MKINIKDLTFESSNTFKLKAFTKHGVSTRTGEDIWEVQGTKEEVILYKILSTEPFTLVDDTVIGVDGAYIIDWKFTKEKYMKDGQDIEWCSSVGYHDGVNVFISTASIPLTLVLPEGMPCATLSFEDYTTWKGIPIPELQELEDYHEMIPSYIALQKLLDGVAGIPVNSVGAWEGAWQGTDRTS